MRKYLDFLEFMVEDTAGEVDFSPEQIVILWTQFVLNAGCPEETKLFFQYLMRQREGVKGYFFSLLIQYE